MVSPLSALEHWATTTPDRVFLRQPERGVYRELTWSEVRHQARQVAGALHGLGLEPGNAVALLAKNCAEWFIADLALMLGGFVSVPIYPTANVGTIRYILEHSESRAVFVGRLDRPNRQSPALRQGLMRLGLPHAPVPVDHGWDRLLDLAEPLTGAPAPTPDQTMTIVYTSGSTGRPKGVVHSFASLSWAGEAIGRHLEATPEDRLVSYLPLAHITERTYIEMGSLYVGIPVAFIESIDTFIQDVTRARPTMFLSVPRLWSLFRERVLRALGERKLDLLLAVPRLGDWMRRRVRRDLGLEHARLLGCGSAPVDPDLLRWYERIGLNISEGWGMTENAAYGTLQLPFRADKIGSVGIPALDSEFRVSEGGELLFRSPGLMSGYYKQPDETAAAITPDGFLRTGDLGYVDEDGYVFVTGRVKDIFKTAKGLYVSPAPIEKILVGEDAVDQACVIGSGLPQPLAVIQLSERARSEGRETVRARLQDLLDQMNDSLAHHERLDAILVEDAPWTVEDGLLTPTLKVKRHNVEQRYAPRARGLRGGRVHWNDELPERR